MRYMLDTDTVSYLIKGKSHSVRARLEALAPSMICISVMTRAELQYGLKHLPADHRLHLAVRQFLKIVRILPWMPKPPIGMPKSVTKSSARAKVSGKWT
jgi:tRNA(fMet)-specific endonuclease VapC